MTAAESSQTSEKRSKKQQMAAKAAAIALMLQNNKGIHISEPPMGAQDAPHTNQSTNGRYSEPTGKGKAKVDMGEMSSNQNSKSKGKVTSKGKTNEPKKVKFNELGQPVGKKAAMFATFLSDTAEGLVPLTVPNWHKDLNAEYKDVIWNHVKKHYIVDDCHRKLCFQSMAKYWREHKSRTIKKIEEKVKTTSVEVVARNTQPANVHSLVDWTKFVKFALSPAEKKRRNRYKELRGRRKLNYRKSKIGFARLAYQMKKQSDKADEITRVDVWLAGYTRKKKDGDEDVEDHEVVRQVKEKMAEQPNSSQWSINDDPVSQVLGPEQRGRVRGYGFGATPSQLIGRGSADRKLIMMLGKKVEEMEMKFKDVLSRLNKVDNSSENNNVAIPSIHIDNSMDDKVVPLKRKEVSNVSTSSKRVKISKDEKQEGFVENVNKQTPQMQHVLLLRWNGTDEKIVSFGDLASKDPDDKVHCIRLGTGVWKVWVREVIEDIALYRQTEEFSTLSTAKGSTVASPSKYVKLL